MTDSCDEPIGKGPASASFWSPAAELNACPLFLFSSDELMSERLVRGFQHHHWPLRAFSNLAGLGSACSEPTPAIVFLHARQFSLQSVAVLRDFLADHPALHPALLTGPKELGPAFDLAGHLPNTPVLPAPPWHAFIDHPCWLDWILTPPKDPLQVYTHMPIRNDILRLHYYEDKEKVWRIQADLLDAMDLGPDQGYDFQLVFEEILNNALFHGFRRPDGSHKYRPESIVELDHHDELWITIQANPFAYGFTLTDNGGALPPDVAIHKIGHQLSARGLLEKCGRGLFLAYTLADRMFLQVWPGAKTQITAIFLHPNVRHADPLPAKPFFFHLNAP